MDEILLPVLKRMNARESQRQQKITQFLPSTSSPSLASPTKQRRSIKSRRIRNVVARLTAGTQAVTQYCSNGTRNQGTRLRVESIDLLL